MSYCVAPQVPNLFDHTWFLKNASMPEKPLLPQLFKGIALFTPGGDLIYSIDPSKQGHWHLHLCASLQEMLGLLEPPHFLVPAYTATIDRWIDPKTRQLRTSAEIYWPVHKYQSLLNSVFDTENLIWQVADWQEESCDPIVLKTYREQFPQLWEDHDLIVRFDRAKRVSHSYASLERDEASYLDSIQKSLRESPEHLFSVPIALSDSVSHSTKEATHTSNIDHASSPETIALTSSQTPMTSPDAPEESDNHLQSLDAHSYVLRLFVSGHSVATEQTLKSLHQLLENSLRHPYTLKVIDIFKHPELAEADQISATPTLLRVWPQPVRRIVGDMNNVEQVLRILAPPEV